MNYKDIQRIRRDILSGRFTAPNPFPEAPLEPLKRKRRRVKVANPTPLCCDWHKEAFNDCFYTEITDDDDLEIKRCRAKLFCKL